MASPSSWSSTTPRAAASGEKRGGTNWVYGPAVSRDQGLKQIARWVVEVFVHEPEDRRHLVLAALRMVGFVRVGDPQALVDHTVRQAKCAAPQPLSDALID